MERPIVLFGTGRSGTTVLMEALFRHPDLAYFSNYLERYPDNIYLNYVRYIFDNRFYRVFGGKTQLYKTSTLNRFINKPTEAYKIWDSLLDDKVNFKRSFLQDDYYSDYSNNIINYIKKSTDYQGKDRFAIKITGPSRIKFFNTFFPDAQFIWLRRSFIPTLSSFLKVQFWQNRKTGNLWWQGGYNDEEMKIFEKIKDNSILFTAFQLKKIIENAEYEIKNLDVNVKISNYENFILDPEDTLSGLLDWLNLSKEKVCFDYIRKYKIVNMNKPYLDYFDSKTLKDIESFIGKDFLERNSFS